jgi:hypothetical protein
VIALFSSSWSDKIQARHIFGEGRAAAGQREETWPVRFVPPARLDWICGLALITLAGALMKRERLVGRVSVEGVGRASDGGVYRKSQARPAATSPKVLTGPSP